MDVGIVGGTGPLGSALGARLAAAGLNVVLGSRSEGRAVDAAARLRERWSAELGERLQGASNAQAAHAGLVVLAVPWDAAARTAVDLAEALAAKTVVSVSNALMRIGPEFVALTPPRGSVAQLLQSALPRSMVVAALHHVPARDLGDLSGPVGADTLVASDFQSSKEQVMEVLSRIPGLRPLDGGSLAVAGALEAMTAVVLNVNLRYRARASVCFTGLGRGDS